jgi:hypothetical protein
MGYRGVALVLAVAAFAIPSDVGAQRQKRVPIPLENSRVGFVGDDSFVTARFARQPTAKNHLWNEDLTFNDGLIQYGELVPNFFYTHGGKYQESRDLIAEWNKQKPFVDKGLTLVPDEIREGANNYGPYFFVVKSNDKGACGYARQVLGERMDAMYGNKRVNVMGCMIPRRGTAQDFEKFLIDVMSRIRLDEGVINKAKAAARSNAAVPAIPSAPIAAQRQSGVVNFTWEGVVTSSGRMDVDNQGGKGPLSVQLQGRSEPCRGFWVMSRGAYNTAQPPEGTWTLNCTDHLSAGGTYTSPKPGQASGIGTDSMGRKITFSYGAK